MNADIITIGDEILIGQVVDTNSAFIGSELTKIGLTIRKIVSISDNEKDIISSLNQSINSSDIIVITGGLGPTNDDITKSTLLKYFGGRLIIHDESLKYITNFFSIRGRPLTDRNYKQAEVPDSCEVLINKSGTAPGMVFEKDHTLIFSLPGVPFEMKEMLINEVIPYIKYKIKLPVRLHRTILTEGIPESTMADILKNWEDNLTEEIKLAYLPSPGLLRLRLSVSGDNEIYLNNILNEEIDKVIGLIGRNNVYGFDFDTLEQKVGELLLEKKSTLSIAESCTGGKISNLITSVSGSSQYFKGSIVAYDNNVKTSMLNVSNADLIESGAVSKMVVEQMAKGVKKLFNTGFSIATSGIAGPGGGTSEKPVGTIWICVLSNDKLITKKFLFGENRERNIIRASLSALNMLRNLIKETK